MRVKSEERGKRRDELLARLKAREIDEAQWQSLMDQDETTHDEEETDSDESERSSSLPFLPASPESSTGEETWTESKTESETEEN